MEDFIFEQIFNVRNGVPSLGGMSIGQPSQECWDRLDILQDAKYSCNPDLVYIEDIFFDYSSGETDVALHVSAKIDVGREEKKIGKEIASKIRGIFYNTEVNENYKTTQFFEDNEFSIVITNDFYEVTVSGCGEEYVKIELDAKEDDEEIYKALYEISQDPDLFNFISASTLIDYPPLFDGYVRSYHGLLEFNSFFFLGGEMEVMRENYEYNYDSISKREKRVKDKGIDIFYDVDEETGEIVEEIRMWVPKNCEQLPDIVNYFRCAFLAEESSIVYEYDEWEGIIKNVDINLSNKYYDLRIWINPNDEDNVRIEVTSGSCANQEILQILRTALKNRKLLGYIVHTHEYKTSCNVKQDKKEITAMTREEVSMLKPKIDRAQMEYRAENLKGPRELRTEDWDKIYKMAGLSDEEIARYEAYLEETKWAVYDPVDAFRD